MSTKAEATPGTVQAGSGHSSDYGVATAPGTLRLERLLPGPIERVWTYLTDSASRGEWLAAGEMELREGGRVDLTFHHADLSAEQTVPEQYKAHAGDSRCNGRILRCEPPRLLSFTWIEGQAEPSQVTFELTPRGDGVLLVLTHSRLPNRGEMVSIASGWHAHLGILADRLAPRAPRPFWSTLLQAEAEYERRLPA
jgi:uncharacterized protein YndB with AHSA1/START domain